MIAGVVGGKQTRGVAGVGHDFIEVDDGVKIARVACRYADEHVLSSLKCSQESTDASADCPSVPSDVLGLRTTEANTSRP